MMVVLCCLCFQERLLLYGGCSLLSVFARTVLYRCLFVVVYLQERLFILLCPSLLSDGCYKIDYYCCLFSIFCLEERFFTVVCSLMSVFARTVLYRCLFFFACLQQQCYILVCFLLLCSALSLSVFYCCLIMMVVTNDWSLL